jgi:hypothetical protein
MVLWSPHSLGARSDAPALERRVYALLWMGIRLYVSGRFKTREHRDQDGEGCSFRRSSVGAQDLCYLLWMGGYGFTFQEGS